MSRSLPPGQKEIAAFPRFGLLQFANRFPRQTSRIELEIKGRVGNPIHLHNALEGLPRVEQTSDFHCVTTWTRRSLRWGGVRFVDFYEQVIAPTVCPESEATLVVLSGQDGARTSMLLADLLAPEVLLADTLDGIALDVDHGAPMRLVAPAHYGYKSVKYLSRIEFLQEGDEYRRSGPRFMEHPRARVALEERGRWVPGWILRYVYRPLIAGTVAWFAKASTRAGL